jgi:hypothetical protein
MMEVESPLRRRQENKTSSQFGEDDFFGQFGVKPVLDVGIPTVIQQPLTSTDCHF